MTERSRLRLVVLRVLVISILATLLGRLAYLQVVQGGAYARVASDNRIREVITSASRGEVLDDRGIPLVRNRTAMVVSVNRVQLRAAPRHGADVLSRLGKVIGVAVPRLALLITPCGEKLADGSVARSPDCWSGSPYQPVPVAQYAVERPADVQRVLTVQEHAEDFPGVSVSDQAVREYPQGSLAAHALGYLGSLSADDLKANPAYQALAPGSLIGRTGLEAEYDTQLRGSDGVQKLLVDKDSTVTGTVGSTPAQAGSDLVLSIDAGVQQAAEVALAKGIASARATGKYKAPGGAAVVLEAATGRLVALASSPTYDPTVFVGGITTQAYAALAKDKLHPLNSNATQGLFPPGSTFKLTSTAAAINAGNSLYGSYNCPPSYRIGGKGGRTFNNFEGETFGRIDLTKTLVKSCDTVYYSLAYDQWVRDGGTKARPGATEIFAKTARSFGFGSKTGIDLPDERAGLITDRRYKQTFWEQHKADYCAGAKRRAPGDIIKAYDQEFCTDGYRYNAGDAALFAIGQGDALVTPVQMAMAYGALANGGTLFEPRLAKAMLSADGRGVTVLPPVARQKVAASTETLDYIRNALDGVTKQGGTAQASFAGFPFGTVDVAGKTGTADVLGKQPTSWFASYAPAAAPRYVVVVMIPEGGTGGTTAAPIARKIWDAMYGLEGAKPVLPADGKLPAGLPVIRPDGSVGAPGTRLAVPPVVATASPTPPPGTAALRAPALPVGALPRRTRDGS